jgi:RNA polymerase sigma factor (sigma-70 family)
MDDFALIQHFVASRCHDAFARIVHRHVNLVYSACHRQLADPHLAEDATQAVFIILTQRASSLSDRVILPGWLHNTARHVCANIRRTESIRRKHEMNASKPDHATPANHQPVDPALLDDALARLSPRDRDAIILRFFSGLSFQHVGRILRISEGAAKKRASRGIEKLRTLLAPMRDAILPAAAIVALLESTSRTASAQLTASAISASLFPAAGPAAAIAKGALAMAAYSKLQSVVVAIALLILATAGGIAGFIALRAPAGSNPSNPLVLSSPVETQPGPGLDLPEYLPPGTRPILTAARPNVPRVPFATIHAEHFDGRSGGQTLAPGIAGMPDESWLLFKNVEFNGPSSMFVVRASSPGGGGTISLRLDNPRANPIAVISLRPTEQSFSSQWAPVSVADAAGVHDVYLTFTGASDVIVDWFKFIQTPRSAFQTIEAESYDAIAGILDQVAFLSNIDRGDFVRYAQIDFGQGAEFFEARLGVKEQYAGGIIEIRLDDARGPVIGTLKVASTGAFTTRVMQRARLTSTPTGVHNLYLTFARSNGVCDLDWFRFTPSP